MLQIHTSDILLHHIWTIIAEQNIAETNIAKYCEIFFLSADDVTF